MMNGKVFVLQSHLDLVSKSQTFVVSKMLQELSSADRWNKISVSKHVKVQLFWEDHKNMRNRPDGFDVY